MIIGSKRTHEGGCQNWKGIFLMEVNGMVFNIHTCLAKCKDNVQCKGVSFGKGRYRGRCALHGLDHLGNECIQNLNPKNWDYYSLKDCIPPVPMP